MNIQKVTFKNKAGQTLVGRIALPIDRHPHNFALFAHCFTCTKNLAAVRNISRELASSGFGVMRFDFTGPGESEGDFADTNFSGNVEDLVAAADFLTQHYSAPTLLVGHSFGGAAVIFAADDIPSVKAVATIAAPSKPAHVKHLLKDDLQEIRSSGRATVDLGGRHFTIKKHFLDDLEAKPMAETLKNLHKALLILHAPQDTTVSIKNAEEIYTAARHPKSFVSLDGADHLLTNQEDSNYVGKVIAGWAYRYLDIGAVENQPKTNHQVVASLDSTEGFTTQMKVGNHYLTADEPVEVGGNDFGPSPYELVSGGLSACTAMTIQMYAKRKKWQIDTVEVHTSYSKGHMADCQDCENPDAKIDTFKREIRLTSSLDEKQIKRILEIADKCPVHKTLNSETQIVTTLLR